jgi:tRNA(Ile)-lysidine synthase
MLPLLHKLDSFLQSQHWDGGDTVVAISGGPDSVALFLALHERRPRTRLVLAHLNHRLRGAESDADEAFVVRLHEKHAHSGVIELRRHQIDVAARTADEAGNMEAVARRLRYAWLEQIAEETQCRWLVTGHNADDQAETVLHRLLRGSGLRGLRGIAPRKRINPNLTLLRPLLGVTRAEILDYLHARDQDYCLDRTNLDRSFTRNRIRHEVLPLLASQYNPDIARLLGQLAMQAEETFARTEALASELLNRAERPRAGALLILDCDMLSAAPRDLLREVFRLVWLREGWPENDMTFDAWDRLAAVACGEGGAADLPGGIHIRVSRRVVQLGPRP